jgi:hypothetical protein
MTTLEILGWAGIAMLFTVFTAQTAFAWGYAIATRNERELADRRINGVLASMNRKTYRGYANGKVVA